MAQRLSQGPLQITTLDTESVNAMLKRIRQELDELRGLRGEVKFLERVTIPTSVNVTRTTVPNVTSPAPITVNQQPLKHDLLGELLDDDHTQYALLGGRIGGQILAGGKAANEKLTLQSTADRSSGGTVDIDDFLNVKSAIQLSGDTTPTTITANVNDYNPGELAISAVLRLASDASRNITGLAGGTDGRVIILCNVGTNNIVLVDESTLSLAPNRFALPLGNITLVADDLLILYYDITSLRWRMIGNKEGITGSGAATQVTFWTGPSTISGDSRFLIVLTPTAALRLDSFLGGQINLEFLDAGTQKWAWYKTFTNGLNLFDYTPNQDLIRILTSVGVAIGYNITPNVRLDVDGALALRRLNVTLANGANNDVAIVNQSNIKIIGPTAAFSTTGFQNGFDGRKLYVFNSVAQTWTIANENASSTAANRITTLTGADVVMRATATSFATFSYDSGTSRWILESIN